MTSEEIERSVAAFDTFLPDGEEIIFNELSPGQEFRHPNIKKHKLYKITFSCPDYIQYVNDGWITRVKPTDPLWSRVVQTF